MWKARNSEKVDNFEKKTKIKLWKSTAWIKPDAVFTNWVRIANV